MYDQLRSLAMESWWFTILTRNVCMQGLRVQILATLDVNVLTPLTPEVISRQATINIGTIGHVAHGKSTVVKAISGVKVSLALRWERSLRLHAHLRPVCMCTADCGVVARDCNCWIRCTTSLLTFAPPKLIDPSCRLFVSRMNLFVTSRSSLDMPMPRSINRINSHMCTKRSRAGSYTPTRRIAVCHIWLAYRRD